MKKYLPLLLLLAGIAAVVLVFVFLRKGGTDESSNDKESSLIEMDLKDRPFVSLTPTSDGHYLTLRIDEINVPRAEIMEYELLYEVPGGVTQGVPGTVDISDLSSFEIELLLGSESSGNYRYDEGVEEGTITVRFRNKDGKMLIKFSSDFHMQSDDEELTSIDGMFSYRFDDLPDGYYVTMPTIGFPGKGPGSVQEGPYGVFSSSSTFPQGEVTIDGGNVYLLDDGNWEMLEDSNAETIGIFVSAS